MSKRLTSGRTTTAFLFTTIASDTRRPVTSAKAVFSSPKYAPEVHCSLPEKFWPVDCRTTTPLLFTTMASARPSPVTSAKYTLGSKEVPRLA
jgi:hypothetical protein